MRKDERSPGAWARLGLGLGLLALGAVVVILGELGAVAAVLVDLLGYYAAFGATVCGLARFDAGGEPALAATLLFRGLSFWLPMAPGLWLGRRLARAGHP